MPPIEDTKKLSVDQKVVPLESHRYKRNGSNLTTQNSALRSKVATSTLVESNKHSSIEDPALIRDSN